MKKNVYTDGNGSSTIHVQGMGDYVPASQLYSALSTSSHGKLIEFIESLQLSAVDDHERALLLAELEK